MGVRFPLPAPSIHIIFSGLRAVRLNFSDSSGTNKVQSASCLFSIGCGSILFNLQQQAIYS